MKKRKMREQECLIDGLRGSTKYSVVVISTPVFSSITDPSSSTSISEVLEVITNPEKNRLDATCAGRNCKISTDGLKVDFTGKGIVLAKEGFKKGVHHWKVVVHSIDQDGQSYLGISLKPPENLDE